MAAALRGGLKDLSVYRYAGGAVLDGLSPFQSHDPVTGLPFTYPPFAAVAMVPLGPLPGWLAAGLWTGASVGALAAAVVVVRRALQRPAPGWLVALVTAGALALEPVGQNLTFGQVNLLLMLAVLVDLVRPERRWSGVLVGIAAGVKLTPLVFVALLVLVGRRAAAGRALLAFAGTVAVGFAVMPGAAASYWDSGLVDAGRVGPAALAHNQSVYGALTRILDGPPSTPVWLAVAAPLALGVLLVGAGWWRRGDRALGTCLGAVAMLLASPISWSHHWVWSVPIALALSERRRWAAGAWTAVFVARPILWPPNTHDREYAWSPLDHVVGNVYLLAALTLAVWAAVALRDPGKHLSVPFAHRSPRGRARVALAPLTPSTRPTKQEDVVESGVTRRGVLRTGVLSGLGIMVAGSVEAIAAPGAMAMTRRSAGYGPLVQDPAGILSLPEGFSYKVIAKAGETVLESGEPSPSDPDGAAVFEDGSGGQVIVLNHEIDGSEPYGVPAHPGLTFDPGARGGTTTIVLDGNGNRVSEYVSVAGTHNNCAGGRTPWDTWLTCEETEARRGGALQYDHGWVFEVDAFDRAANQDPVPLKFLGRYAHEAVAVDPASSTIYLTEDANGPHGLYYRWTPPAGFTGGKGALRALALASGGDTAGGLQAMSCSKGGRHIQDLSEATQVGTRYKVTWVDVPDRLATSTSTRQQFTPDQVTGSRKLEGAYWGDGGAYFVASFARADDGSRNEHDGQVWFYDPATETVTLKTIFGVNPDPDADTNYDGPDNIVVDPHGGLILAEDGEGVQHLVGVTDQGKSYPMARNDVSDSEFTGPTFTADGRLLFANIQGDGYVFAITGPWDRASNER